MNSIGAAVLVEDVRERPVREHIERCRVSLVLVGKQLGGLDNESDVPVVVHAHDGVARAHALARIGRVPFGVERFNVGRGVTGSRDSTDPTGVVSNQSVGIGTGTCGRATRIAVRRREGHSLIRALAVLQECLDR